MSYPPGTPPPALRTVELTCANERCATFQGGPTALWHATAVDHLGAVYIEDNEACPDCGSPGVVAP